MGLMIAVVAAFEAGHSPETIQQQFPALTLEEVYGAITHCLSHPEDVRAYLDRQDSLWERLRTEAATTASPVVKRLRALRAADVSDEGNSLIACQEREDRWGFMIAEKSTRVSDSPHGRRGQRPWSIRLRPAFD